MQIKQVFNIFIILILGLQFSFSQGKPFSGPEDPAGDIAAEKEGYMTCLLYTSPSPRD